MGKFESYTEKTNPVDNDILLIGDSESLDGDGDYRTKKLKNSNIKVEGTKVKSTGESGAIKFLREDGDGTSSWQQVEGTTVLSTGETGARKFLREDGDNSSSWQSIDGIMSSGIIKSSTSVVNGSTLSSISDWSGSAGAYTSTITLNNARAYTYINNIVFYQLSGSDYIQVIPTEVKVTGTSTIVITMPVNGDLYLGLI